MTFYLFWISSLLKKEWLKILVINTATLFLALLVAELYFWQKSLPLKTVKKTTEINSNTNLKPQVTNELKGQLDFSTGDYATNRYMVPQAYLGYGPKGDGVYTSKRVIKGKVIYDIVYTISNGIRLTPKSQTDLKSVALFFGCSFTVGEGLNDNETLPYFFNRANQFEYSVFNYGFHGYGPHQMLSFIENRVSKDIIEAKEKKIAVYSFLMEHPSRAAGRSSWDQNGPRYEMKHGELKHVGTFSILPGKLGFVVSVSHIYKRLFTTVKPGRNDFVRTVEIIKKSRNLLGDLGVPLVVFIWDYNASLMKEDYDFLVKELINNNIPLFYLHDVLPDYLSNQAKYVLSLDDCHPNALANEKIGLYLAKQIDLIQLKR